MNAALISMAIMALVQGAFFLFLAESDIDAVGAYIFWLIGTVFYVGYIIRKSIEGLRSDISEIKKYADRLGWDLRIKNLTDPSVPPKNQDVIKEDFTFPKIKD